MLKYCEHNHVLGYKLYIIEIKFKLDTAWPVAKLGQNIECFRGILR